MRRFWRLSCNRWRRVVVRVVECVAPADPLDGEAGGLVDHFSIARLAAAEGAPVREREVLAQGIGQEFRCIENAASLPIRLLTLG